MTRLPRSIWISVLLVSALVFCWRLNTVPLTNWDEGIYANTNLELFHSQDWTKLTYFGAKFLEKPPLQFWGTYVLFGVFGPTEFAVRLWSALAGIATALLLALWGWQATQKKSVAWIAALSFVFGRFALIHAFRTGDLDGLMTLFIVVAMYAYWRSLKTPRWFLIWGVATAAAVMTKSVAGLIPLFVVGLDILISRGWRRIGWGNIGWGVGALIIFAAPWHIIETVRFGSKFWDDYLGWNIIQRSTESLFTKTPWYWYFGIIRDRWFPFSYLLPLVIITAGWRAWKQRSDLDRLLLIWGAIVLIFFTLIQTRREWYILPFYPAAALLVAITVERWWNEKQNMTMKVFAILTSIAMFAYIPVDHHLKALLAHIPVFQKLSSGFWISKPGQLAFGIVVMSIILVVAWLLRKYKFSLQRWTMVGIGGAMMLMAVIWTVQYTRSLPTDLPLKTIAARLEQEHVQNVMLIGTKLKKQPAGYFYILRLDTHSQEYPVGTSPRTPLIITTSEPQNAPLNTEGKVLAKDGVFVLLDLR